MFLTPLFYEEDPPLNCLTHLPSPTFFNQPLLDHFCRFFKDSGAIKFISWINPWNKKILKFFMSLRIFYYKKSFWFFLVVPGYSTFHYSLYLQRLHLFLRLDPITNIYFKFSRVLKVLYEKTSQFYYYYNYYYYYYYYYKDWKLNETINFAIFYILLVLIYGKSLRSYGDFVVW